MQEIVEKTIAEATRIINAQPTPPVQQIKAEDKTSPEPEPQDRYFVIKLAPMKDKMDIPVPTITVGNKVVKHQRLSIRRGTWVPVTLGHVEVFENTKYPVYKNVEGEDRKVAEYRTRFPLDGKIEISHEGYMALRQLTLAGKEITEKDFEPFKV